MITAIKREQAFGCTSFTITIKVMSKSTRYVLIQLTLLFAVSYISPSTLRAYETRFPMRRSLRAAGSCTGVGKIAVTLQQQKQFWYNTF